MAGLHIAQGKPGLGQSPQEGGDARTLAPGVIGIDQRRAIGRAFKVKGGQAVGASDPIGAVPADRPVGPSEIVATIFKSLGFDLETELPGPGGRPFPLVNYGSKPINELFG